MDCFTIYRMIVTLSVFNSCFQPSEVGLNLQLNKAIFK